MLTFKLSPGEKGWHSPGCATALAREGTGVTLVSVAWALVTGTAVTLGTGLRAPYISDDRAYIWAEASETASAGDETKFCATVTFSNGTELRRFVVFRIISEQ